MNRVKVLAPFVFASLLPCSCRLVKQSLWDTLRVESPERPRTTKSPSWDALDLGFAKLHGATLYYEKSLEPSPTSAPDWDFEIFLRAISG